MQDRARCGSQGSILLGSDGDERRTEMIVDRRTFRAKKGQKHEAAAVLKEVAKLFTAKVKDVPIRIYHSHMGTFDTVAMEVEYESLAEYERLMYSFFALPEMAPLMKKWNEVTETGGTHEMWGLEE
jgi:hypothetical protein